MSSPHRSPCWLGRPKGGLEAGTTQGPTWDLGVRTGLGVGGIRTGPAERAEEARKAHGGLFPADSARLHPQHVARAPHTLTSLIPALLEPTPPSRDARHSPSETHRLS